MQFQLSRKVILASAIALASQVSFVQAAGYGINEQSASYLGTGFAGRASNAIDASISATNPAGISFVEGTQVSVGADVILEGGDFNGSISGVGPTRTGSTKDFQKTAFVPFGYFVMPVDDKWSFGLAGYAPYGIELDYEDGWVGQSFAKKTSVQVMNIQGTVSYKFNDDLSVGFGLIGSHVKGELTSKAYGLIDGNIEGDDNTVAWNIGTIWNVTDTTTLGLAYHSKLDFKLGGTYTTSISPEENVSLSIVMPEKLMASATHKLDEQWTLMADITWTRWSRFKEFDVVKSDGSGSAYYVPMNWDDTWALSLGTSYQLNDQWLLRAGYMFDESPVSDEFRTARSPDANRNWFTFGANWKVADNMNVDFAYAYVKLKDGAISEVSHGDLDYGLLEGTFSSSSHILGAQLNYKF